MYYTQKDIARELGLDHKSINNLRKEKPDLYPHGRFSGGRIVFTESEKEEFLEAFYSTRMPKYIHEGLKTKEWFFQKHAASYLGETEEHFRRFQKRTKNSIPFEKHGRNIFYKKSNLDEFIKSGADLMSPRYRKMTNTRKGVNAKKREQEKKNNMPIVKPYVGPERECCVPGCKEITTNRMMCDSCQNEYYNCIGDQ